MARATELILGGLAALAAFGIYAYGTPGASASPRVSASQMSDELRREVEALERQLSDVRAEQQLWRGAAANSHSGGEEPPAATRTAFEPQDAPAEPEALDDAAGTAAAQGFAQLAVRFESEARDPAWADRAEEQLQAALAAEAVPGVTVRRASCAATLCRLETDAVDRESLDRFAQELPGKTEFLPRGRLRVPTDDGNVKTIYYLARDLPLSDPKDR